MCSFSFPVVFGLFLSLAGIRTDKKPYRAKVVGLFWSRPRLILNFVSKCQYFFYLFQDRSLRWPFAKKEEFLRGGWDMDHFAEGPVLCCLR
jgi:hypothetical protein